jgi:hypothetical protein
MLIKNISMPHKIIVTICMKQAYTPKQLYFILGSKKMNDKREWESTPATFGSCLDRSPALPVFGGILEALRALFKNLKRHSLKRRNPKW